MIADITIDTAPFDFTGCFYPSVRIVYGNKEQLNEMICNVTVACAIALVLIGSWQDACSDMHQLMAEITGIAKDDRTAEAKTAALRKRLGELMQYNVSEKKLVDKGSNDDLDDVLVSVDQVQKLYHFINEIWPEGRIRFESISFLLAFFNLLDTVPPSLEKDDILNRSSENSYLYTVFNIMLYTLPQGNAPVKPYNDGKCWLLPFLGTDCIGLVGPINSPSVTPPEGLKEETLTKCLTAMQSAINTANHAIETKTNNSCYCDNRCYSLKRIFRKHLHIILFVIAGAALLAGGAVALTTYFHVGTSLMLAPGFIPFLNFAIGFQISFLLEIVAAATASVGIDAFIKTNPNCCFDKCGCLLPAQDFQEVFSAEKPR
jgi:hypothetical protein